MLYPLWAIQFCLDFYIYKVQCRKLHTHHVMFNIFNLANIAYHWLMSCSAIHENIATWCLIFPHYIALPQ